MNLSKMLFAAVALAIAPSVASSAMLTAVPMQGGMVMPTLSYSTASGRLHVVVDPTIPQLTPLLVSNPGDSFEPGDPWFDALDPSRQSQSFSRRYGFVMGAGTDPLPAGTEMWIRKVSGSAALSVYRYANTAPKAFEPIFGTGGSPNAVRWNGVMFHPTFASPAGTNGYTATFEAYLVHSSTGAELPNTSTGPFVFNWTNVPDGRPELEIASRIVISWPTNTTNYVLEGTDTLIGGSWTTVTNAPVFIEGASATVLDRGETRQYFRLKRMP